ncbi:MAG: hypothetical protein VB047_00035 [Anaerotignum propionicum]|uniref:hypothetical protein n=1 Tax=Anaerotignum propionicum TaxID=28446 RepID=UPI002B2089CA|nr:hypothetical protein [Anaerotignum propionicum]MEA5055934.1 hypothetical protein [Anaerotignum propionicum]
MALSKFIKSVVSAASSVAKKYTSGSGSSASSGSSGGSRNSSSGYFDQNKDYASAINSTTDAAQKAQLVAERQNKLDWMNATGQNTNGYSNSIYSGQTTSSFGNPTTAGSGSGMDMDKIKRDALNSSMQSSLKAMEQNSQLYATANPQEQARLIAENQGYSDQLKKLGVIPFQKDGRYYYNRPDDQTSETEGNYSGDSSLSLPDLALLRQYQNVYNDAKAKKDNTGMEAAHQMAEKLRDNYRYYPTKNSSGYGLGQNDIGFIRDMTARVDDLGNRYVDQYNRNSVTTNAYDSNGNLSYTHTGGDINAHKARVAAQIANTNSNLAAQGKENNTFAVRLSDPKDLSLSNDALRSQYGMSGRLMNYSGDYYRPQTEQMGYSDQRISSELGGYESIANYLEQARNARLEQSLAQLEQEKSQSNLNFDEIARQAYIANRQSQMNLPQQLAAMGISGGASETAQLGLTTTYQNNLNSNEQARQRMVQQMANSALQARLQADSDIGGYYADAQQSALAAYQQQQAQQQAYDQWAQQFNYQQRQDSLDREWQQTQLNNSNKQYQDSLKQYELEMALKLGDYSRLGAAGYDTNYLQKMQQAELSKIFSQSAKKSSAKKAVEEEPVQAPVGNTVGNGWVSVSGYGRLGFEEVDKLLQSGAVREVLRNGKLFYEKVK